MKNAYFFVCFYSSLPVVPPKSTPHILKKYLSVLCITFLWVIATPVTCLPAKLLVKKVITCVKFIFAQNQQTPPPQQQQQQQQPQQQQQQQQQQLQQQQQQQHQKE